jgi:hypothetical protein
LGYAAAWGQYPAKHVGTIVVLVAGSIELFQATIFEVALV